MLLIVITRMLKLSPTSIRLYRPSLFVRISTVHVKSEVIVVEHKTNEPKEIDEILIRKDTVVDSLESAVVLDRLLEISLPFTVLVSC
jgi:hypothetical protein